MLVFLLMPVALGAGEPSLGSPGSEGRIGSEVQERALVDDWITIPRGVADPQGLRGFVVSTERRLECLDLATGRVLWTGGEGWEPLLATAGGVFVAEPGETLHSARFLLVVAGEVVWRSAELELGLSVSPAHWRPRRVGRQGDAVELELDLFLPAPSSRGGRRRRLVIRADLHSGRVSSEQLGVNPYAASSLQRGLTRDGRCVAHTRCQDLDGAAGAEHCVRSLVEVGSGARLGSFVTDVGANRNLGGIDGAVGGRLFALGDTPVGVEAVVELPTDEERERHAGLCHYVRPSWLVSYDGATGRELWRHQVRGITHQIACPEGVESGPVTPEQIQGGGIGALISRKQGASLASDHWRQ